MIQRQAIDIESAEKSLIGSAINKPRLIPKLGSMVRPQHFAGPQLGQFWAVVSDFSLAEKPMDVVTLLEPAKRIWGDNAAGILGELITFVPHADHADYYAKLVVDGFRIRNYERIAIGLKSRTEDLSESPSSIEAWLQDQLDDQLGTRARNRLQPIPPALNCSTTWSRIAVGRQYKLGSTRLTVKFAGSHLASW